jgi:aspartyl/glutamyl-tRNA(Asn/Gln) amidotransferase C subunit
MFINDFLLYWSIVLHIADSEIQRLGTLCRIACSPEQTQALKRDLTNIINWIGEINTINTTTVSTALTDGADHNLRDDLVTSPASLEVIKAMAPQEAFAQGLYRVPQIVGD